MRPGRYVNVPPFPGMLAAIFLVNLAAENSLALGLCSGGLVVATADDDRLAPLAETLLKYERPIVRVLRAIHHV